eukprot:11563-Chlamydomonas_euryale.AAC.8
MYVIVLLCPHDCDAQHVAQVSNISVCLVGAARQYAPPGHLRQPAHLAGTWPACSSAHAHTAPHARFQLAGHGWVRGGARLWWYGVAQGVGGLGRTTWVTWDGAMEWQLEWGAPSGCH